MRNLAWITVCLGMTLMACSEETATGACGDSPFVGSHLWQIGNCETGTVTPFAEDMCSASLCGGNARDPVECTGNKLFPLSISGVVAQPETGERMEWTRDLDCSRPPLSDVSACAAWACAVTHDPDFYVGRFPDRAPEEQYFADDLWLRIDRPWPGRDACFDDAEVTARIAAITDACPTF